MVWYFIGLYIINRTLHDRLEIQHFCSLIEKYFTCSLRSLVKYFQHSKRSFLYPCWQVISMLLTPKALWRRGQKGVE